MVHFGHIAQYIESGAPLHVRNLPEQGKLAFA